MESGRDLPFVQSVYKELLDDSKNSGLFSVIRCSRSKISFDLTNRLRRRFLYVYRDTHDDTYNFQGYKYIVLHPCKKVYVFMFT